MLGESVGRATVGQSSLFDQESAVSLKLIANIAWEK